jgi:solute carrier family 45 protein 1/2/4
MSRHSQESLNERSPLISPQVQPERAEDSDVEDSHLSESLHYDVTTLESKSAWYLFLLTLSIGGLQIVWSVELSNGSPYLLSLGMSKSLLAFVWIAGPLSGALVQPYVGIRSDNCRIPWGKRKPFMIAGGAATVVALLALAWTREMVRGFLGLFGVASDSNSVKVTAIVIAILFMYVLDFAINTGEVQCPSSGKPC